MSISKPLLLEAIDEPDSDDLPTIWVDLAGYDRATPRQGYATTLHLSTGAPNREKSGFKKCALMFDSPRAFK